MVKIKDYILIETLLKFYGLWHRQSANGRKIIFYLHEVLIVSAIFGLGAGLTEKGSKKLSKVYENTICMAYFAGAAIKYAILFSKREKIQQLYDRFLSDCTEEVNREEKKLLNKYVSRGRLINRMLLVYGVPAFGLIAGLAFHLTSLDSLDNISDNYFPIYYYRFLDEYYHYRLVTVHMVAVYISVTFCYYMTCAIFLLMCSYVCGLYSISRQWLENVMEFPDNGSAVVSNSKSLMLTRDDRIVSNLKTVVSKHNEAVQVVQQVEDSFSAVIGVVQIAALICFGFTMFGVLGHNGTNRHLLRNIITMTIYFVYVYILNWSGQEVLNECNALFTTSYSIEWYTMSAKAKKSLLFVQLRARKSEMLTAAPVFILSLANFSWILQTSWSITAVLRSSQK